MPPPRRDSRTLAVLRTLRGWGQKELGRAAGLTADTISGYERQHDPGPERLRHLGGLMGFPSSFVERARSFVAAGLDWCLAGAAGPEDAAARQEMEALATGEAARYEEFLRRSWAALDRAVETRLERRQASRLWRRLRRHPPERWPALVKLDEEFWSWGLVEHLCEESERAAARDPGEALALARLAEEVARRVPGTDAWRARLAGFAGCSSCSRRDAPPRCGGWPARSRPSLPPRGSTARRSQPWPSSTARRWPRRLRPNSPGACSTFSAAPATMRRSASAPRPEGRPRRRAASAKRRTRRPRLPARRARRLTGSRWGRWCSRCRLQ